MVVNGIFILDNPVLPYAWGSRTAIPDLLGRPGPSPSPQAELWMGAHAKAPSQVEIDGETIGLDRLIAKHPVEILGKGVAEKFRNRLPYLYKVLAPEHPLSIQAHPSRDQARIGFERENRLGIPLDAPDRNYRDDNHKPECICALSRFWALVGFRKREEMIPLMEAVSPRGLASEIRQFKDRGGEEGMKEFFHALMTLASERRQAIVREAAEKARELERRDPVCRWVAALYAEYPDDIGILSPVFLNLVSLEPGEALFLEAGELHAYLRGTGIELMANSDNVLRGGLTPKHIDVPELLNLLHFAEKTPGILLPEPISDTEGAYPTRAEEFILSVISLQPGTVHQSSAQRSAEILLCTEGSATVSDGRTGLSVKMKKGNSVLVSAALYRYSIEGDGRLYKAAVPIDSRDLLP